MSLTSHSRRCLLQNLGCQLLFVRNISKMKKRKLLHEEDELPVLKFKTPRPEDRRIYAWGLAETGALGVHKNIKKHKSTESLFVQHPTRIQFAEQFDVTYLACGFGFTLYTVKQDKLGASLFGTGINTDSQLGFQQNKYRHTLERITYPVPIEIKHPVTSENVIFEKCAAGRAHSLLLSNQGEVFTLGNNSYGQCARPIVKDEDYLGSSVVNFIPKLAGEAIRDVVCGQDHSFFITKSGRVFACGWAADGQTGLEHYKITHQPTEVRGDIKGENIVKISCRSDCNLALNDKGEVFGWGNSEYGQFALDEQQQLNVPRYLEITKGLSKIVDIATTGTSCLILNENGDVFTWGYGLLGFGPNVLHEPLPKQLPPTLFGRNQYSPNNTVVAVRGGLYHAAALDAEGSVYTWGRNKYACLGLGHEKDQYFPFKAVVNCKVVDIQLGADHSMALGKAYLS
ncbi:RCC1-like G exchanging factor-like protein [Culicoides brevitarsis]|uniref:RCC1-like G exchanging factor-like protein n=1 Tax=Culicoides brevitarsis TaxID=469753 RepID=UPI00307B731A